MDFERLWFKLYCYYQANTELFDRKLTDTRSPYDKTEAYINCSNKSASNSHAIYTNKFIREVADDLRIPIDVVMTNHIAKRYVSLSAQGWIDIYNNLINIGEMDFLKKYCSIDLD